LAALGFESAAGLLILKPGIKLPSKIAKKNVFTFRKEMMSNLSSIPKFNITLGCKQKLQNFYPTPLNTSLSPFKKANWKLHL
jgi:hypothetical protein